MIFSVPFQTRPWPSSSGSQHPSDGSNHTKQSRTNNKVRRPATVRRRRRQRDVSNGSQRWWFARVVFNQHYSVCTPFMHYGWDTSRTTSTAFVLLTLQLHLRQGPVVLWLLWLTDLLLLLRVCREILNDKTMGHRLVYRESNWDISNFLCSY